MGMTAALIARVWTLAVFLYQDYGIDPEKFVKVLPIDAMQILKRLFQRFRLDPELSPHVDATS